MEQLEIKILSLSVFEILNDHRLSKIILSILKTFMIFKTAQNLFYFRRWTIYLNYIYYFNTILSLSKTRHNLEKLEEDKKILLLENEDLKRKIESIISTTSQTVSRLEGFGWNLKSMLFVNYEVYFDMIVRVSFVLTAAKSNVWPS